MIKDIIRDIETKKIESELNLLSNQHTVYSHEGIFNDFHPIKTTQLIVYKEREPRKYVLFYTSNAISPNYLGLCFARISIVDSHYLIIDILLKKYVIVFLAFWILIFATMIIFSLKDENPLFLFHILIIIIGVIAIYRDTKKFKQNIIDIILNFQQ